MSFVQQILTYLHKNVIFIVKNLERKVFVSCLLIDIKQIKIAEVVKFP